MSKIGGKKWILGLSEYIECSLNTLSSILWHTSAIQQFFFHKISVKVVILFSSGMLYSEKILSLSE